MATDQSSSTSSTVTELIQSMEQAILAAKQLPSSSGDPTRLHQIQASLHRAHGQLSAFLCLLPPPAEDQSLSSSDEPMQLEDQPPPPPEKETSVQMVDRVEEKMRTCFIRTKRPKRRLSPEYGGGDDDEGISGGGGGGGEGFDPYATRSRALELVYQFHA